MLENVLNEKMLPENEGKEWCQAYQSDIETA